MKKLWKIFVPVCLLSIAGIICLAFMTGWLNWQTVRIRYYSIKQSFSQQASQVSPSNQPSSNAARNAQICRDNMRRIETAKRSVARKKSISAGAISWSDVVAELGGTAPRCPDGGTYRPGSLEVLCTCSVGRNNSSDPALEHILRNF